MNWKNLTKNFNERAYVLGGLQETLLRLMDSVNSYSLGTLVPRSIQEYQKPPGFVRRFSDMAGLRDEVNGILRGAHLKQVLQYFINYNPQGFSLAIVRGKQSHAAPINYRQYDTGGGFVGVVSKYQHSWSVEYRISSYKVLHDRYRSKNHRHLTFTKDWGNPICPWFPSKFKDMSDDEIYLYLYCMSHKIRQPVLTRSFAQGMEALGVDVYIGKDYTREWKGSYHKRLTRVHKFYRNYRGLDASPRASEFPERGYYGFPDLPDLSPAKLEVDPQVIRDFMKRIQD